MNPLIQDMSHTILYNIHTITYKKIINKYAISHYLFLMMQCNA